MARAGSRKVAPKHGLGFVKGRITGNSFAEVREMRRLIVVGLSAALAVSGAASAQAPLSDVLVNAKRAYLANSGVERQWLDRLAAEFVKAKRFQLVNSLAEADVVVTLSRGRGTDVFVPIAGAFVGGENEAFRLVITAPDSTEVLWDDSREAGFTVGGALGSLSKRLHDRLKKERPK